LQGIKFGKIVSVASISNIQGIMDQSCSRETQHFTQMRNPVI